LELPSSGSRSNKSKDEALARQLQEEENNAFSIREAGHTNTKLWEDEALALRLQTEENAATQVRRPKNASTTSRARQEDEALARRLQEEENQTSSTASSAFSSIFGRPVHPVSAGLSSTNHCTGCKQPITDYSYLTVGNPPTKFHPSCFRCAGCNKPIEGSYMTKDTDCYHRACFDALFVKSCDLCGATLRGRYMCHGYFTDVQSYCAEHNSKPLRQCFCCHIKEPFASKSQGASGSSSSEPFPTLPDGRLICWRCIDSVVVDSEEARPLYLAAVDFMEHSLGLSIPPGMREVPVLAVDLPSLNDQLSLQSSTTHGACPHTDPAQSHGVAATGGGGASLTRGLTLTSVSEVRYVQPGGAWSHNWLAGGIGMGRGTSSASSSSVTLERTCSVTAVLVLCGLPRDLTASILAHEAMHVWCKLRSSPLLNLPSEVEEGMCQLVAYEYLDKCAGSSRTEGERVATTTAVESPWETKLRAYFKYQIQTDPSPVYGDGFRMAAEGCAALGFSLLIEHVATSNNFPNV
jgi:hypothetical protein